ncbi:unnamed protein product [Adineta steineri]|uniref:Uncharacterized protein n=1 Tax=Adineta steineri TaxID=433720 RepID=A0A814F9V7_9BILA|nr:unnamed protein product [Adineta steineri]CAF0977809.1 unnamed protein product [Adineta steineri]CAF3507975.1 unnamed protein product [Adineta steineri]CAF3749303.1 unnamed protein product [Adineta steineri]
MQGQNNTNDNENDKIQHVSSPYNFSYSLNIITLNVGLFPWAASNYLEHNRQVIEHYWYNVLDNKHIRLNWLPLNVWDGGYNTIPQDYFDVYIYDTLYMNYYISQGWLSILDRNEITYAHEINSNILSMIESDNRKYYGIPIYGCFYLLIYHSKDKELASIKTFEDLVEIASKRHFLMRKLDGELKMSNYLTLVGSDYHINHITEENININVINQLSHFYKHAKLVLNETDRHSFKHSSFYIGYAEDINTVLSVDENDLSQIEFMPVPFNNDDRPQFWLDCIGIHPQAKSRGLYEKSLQLANLMTCSTVLNEYLQEQFYVITTNHITLSHLSAKNAIYAKLQILMESNSFRPSSLPFAINSSLSVKEQRMQAIALIIAQHQKQSQSIANTNTNTNTNSNINTTS